MTTISCTSRFANSLYERYQLERFAEWQGQDDKTAHYHITVEIAVGSHSAGVKIDQVLNFLKRISKDQVPPVVTRSLQAWGGQFWACVDAPRAGAADHRRRDDAPAAQAPRDTRASGTAAFADTRVSVDEDKVEELTAKLKEIGIWPHVRSSSEDRRGRGCPRICA